MNAIIQLGRKYWSGPRKKICLVAIIIASAWSWHQYHIPNYIPAKMPPLFSTVRTHCIGRYLIDLPENLGNPWVSNVVLYYGLDKNFKTVEIEMPQPNGITRVDFNQKIQSRRSELETEIQGKAKIPLLLHEFPVSTSSGMTGILFRRLSSSSAVVSEMHLLIGDRYVTLQSESYPSEEAYRQESNHLYKLVDPREAEARILAIAQKLRAITASNNTSTGFCMNNVLIEGTDLPYDDERAEFEFAVKAGEKSTLRLTIATNGRSGYPAETLHSRISLIKLVVGPLNQEVSTRVIRRTNRSIEGDEFQEWAGEVYRKKEKISQFGFQLEKIETKKNFAPSFLRPGINITLAAGEFGSSNSASPYSLHQLEPAWDQWIASFRISPASGGKRE